MPKKFNPALIGILLMCVMLNFGFLGALCRMWNEQEYAAEESENNREMLASLNNSSQSGEDYPVDPSGDDNFGDDTGIPNEVPDGTSDDDQSMAQDQFVDKFDSEDDPSQLTGSLQDPNEELLPFNG